jgi:hypothetical protein
MKGWVIFMALAAPIVLTSPVFWWLVQFETGAAQGTVVEHDGVARASSMGPRSPWPDWVSAPENAKLTVRTYLGDAPGHPAMGYGDLAFARPPLAELEALSRRPGEDGWSIASVRYDTVEPTLPPRNATVCVVTAQRADPHPRTIMYSLMLGSSQGRVHWSSAPPPPGWATVGTQPCF